MEQFMQIGEVVGSLKAFMVLKHDILINQRQCCLLFDMYLLAFETISDEIRQNLRLDERSTKWRALEYPMKELHKIIKEGDQYIKYCLDMKDWWGKAMSLHMNRDCIEFHIHNLLYCFPVVIEAIETAAEISGLDEEVMFKRRFALMKKYDTEWSDPKLFQWMLGKQYLVSRDICSRLENAWKEDRWLLFETIREKKKVAPASLAKHEQRLADLLLKKLDGSQTTTAKLLPSSVLVGASDYYVKRRLGSGAAHFKEIQWLGESFALRTFYGEIEPLLSEISLVLSLSHPNTLQHLCGFYDEERKEGFLVMELMHKNLETHIKENCGQRKRPPFSLPAAVDIMLQIARGMEYLHSKQIYHGDLNPSHILIKQRSSSMEGYFLAKVTGFGLTSIKNYTYRNSPKGNGVDPVIWYAPEVLAEQEQRGGKSKAKYTEKADVYSFGMLCFELLTGKIPFEDDHLQGEKMVRNIRAGGRPLFPYPAPKYLANLTRKCWQSNPSLRPNFSSICRILRYIKKILIINPDHGQPESPPPLVDYCDIEIEYSKKLSGESSSVLAPVSRIPFQLFVYRLVQKEKIIESSKNKIWDLSNEGSLARGTRSLCDDEHFAVMDELLFVPSDRRSVCSEIIERTNSLVASDQRSTVSEVPHRKLFQSDERSVCSESPRTKFMSVTTVDRRSTSSLTPERNFSTTQGIGGQSSSCPGTPLRATLSSTNNQKKNNVEIQEKETSSTVVDHNSTILVSSEANPSIITTAEENPVVENKPLTTDQKPAIYETSLKKKYKMRVNKQLSDIPEIKNLEATTTKQNPASSKNKNTVKNANSINKPVRKSNRFKSLEKKELLKGEKRETTKTTTDSPGISKDRSPTGSAMRITRTCSYPTSSPARSLKERSSYPTYSPARSLKERSASRYSSSISTRAYSSPQQSPLNPCQRWRP